MAATTESPTAVRAVGLYWLATEAENTSLKEENAKLKETIKNLTRSHKVEIESLSTQMKEIKDVKDHYEECFNSVKQSCYDQSDIIGKYSKEMESLTQDMKTNKDRYQSQLKEKETENKKLMEIIVNSNQTRKELEDLVKNLRNKLEIKMKSNNSDSTQDVKHHEL